MRFQATLQRVSEQIERNQTGQMQQKLSALLEDLKTDPKQSDRIAVKSGGRIIFLKFAEVDWVEAADNYVKLHVGNDSHLLRHTMASFEARLPKETFLRISRSSIVNV